MAYMNRARPGGLGGEVAAGPSDADEDDRREEGDEDRLKAAGQHSQWSSFLPGRRGERAERRLGRGRTAAHGLGPATGRPTGDSSADDRATCGSRGAWGTVRIRADARAARADPHCGIRAASARVSPSAALSRKAAARSSDVVEDRLERVPEPRVRDQLGVRRAAAPTARSSSIRANGSASPDSSRTGQRMAGQWAIRASVRSGAPGGWSG